MLARAACALALTAAARSRPQAITLDEVIKQADKPERQFIDPHSSGSKVRLRVCVCVRVCVCACVCVCVCL